MTRPFNVNEKMANGRPTAYILSMEGSVECGYAFMRQKPDLFCRFENGMGFACLPSELVARVPAQRRDWSESYHWQGEKSLQMHGGIKARETS
jgi:hypothetical protein